MGFETLATVSAVTVLVMTLLWLFSLWRRDASLVDLYWAPGFAVITVAAAVGAPGLPARQALIATLTTLWGIRLFSHLFRRNWGHGEDFRYAAMRKHHGQRFAIISLFTVFYLQGALQIVISLPLQAAAAAQTPLGIFDGLGATLALIGLNLEGIADLQLRRFRSNPDNQKRVLDSGLWRYSRHPNYFGNALLWWGFGCFGLAAGAPWTLIGPAVMTFLLLKVSGVAMLEKTIGDRRPEYAEYIRTTSAFIPLPKKR